MSDLLARLADKFTVGDGCWVWSAARGADGYGHIWHEGRTLRAHRVLYELLVGPIPEGLQLDHLCRNRACVRPAHLEPVTSGENSRRGNTGKASGAQQQAKTHCAAGHVYAGENLYVRPNGHRECLACCRARDRKRRAAAARPAPEEENGTGSDGRYPEVTMSLEEA